VNSNVYNSTRLRPAILATAACVLLGCPATASAMHISEGILPAPWAGLWFALSVPFLVWGLRDLRQHSEREPMFKSLVGLVGAAVFVISCMPIPVPWAGTCSHPCGTGMAALLIGPTLTVVITSIALLLQALFLAHGGLTTLGADIISMGVAGAFVGYGVFRISMALGLPRWPAAFLAGLLSDWATYAVTSFELASALHGNTGVGHTFVAVALAFCPTQIPLGILEGVITVAACRFIEARRPGLIASLRLPRGGAA
jgi:cobalt/nickel transport system permease protein